MQGTLWFVLGLAGLGGVSGLLGALVGIGGGVVIVPVLVLLFGVDIRAAVAASLVAVVAGSTAAGSVYVGSGAANMRLGMTLEVATTLGGISGGLLAVVVSPRVLAAVFGVMLGVTAVLMARHGEPPRGSAPPARPREEPGRLGGAYPGPGGELVTYGTRRLPLGMAISFAAGVASGMLGVGGGFLKVPAMVLGMGVPFRAAAATSNFMIGVTAAASLFVYFARGDVAPALAAPIALGVTAGALAGTALTGTFGSLTLRRILAAVLMIVGFEMILQAFGASLGR